MEDEVDLGRIDLLQFSDNESIRKWELIDFSTHNFATDNVDSIFSIPDAIFPEENGWSYPDILKRDLKVPDSLTIVKSQKIAEGFETNLPMATRTTDEMKSSHFGKKRGRNPLATRPVAEVHSVPYTAEERRDRLARFRQRRHISRKRFSKKNQKDFSTWQDLECLAGDVDSIQSYVSSCPSSDIRNAALGPVSALHVSPSHPNAATLQSLPYSAHNDVITDDCSTLILEPPSTLPFFADIIKWSMAMKEQFESSSSGRLRKSEQMLHLYAQEEKSSTSSDFNAEESSPSPQQESSGSGSNEDSTWSESPQQQILQETVPFPSSYNGKHVQNCTDPVGMTETTLDAPWDQLRRSLKRRGVL